MRKGEVRPGNSRCKVTDSVLTIITLTGNAGEIACVSEVGSPLSPSWLQLLRSRSPNRGRLIFRILKSEFGLSFINGRDAYASDALGMLPIIVEFR
jgi:hypothetical protein